MAKVLISYFSEYGSSTYEGLSESLSKMGNDVLLINWLRLISYQKTWGSSKLVDYGVLEQVLEFNPTFVLNYNNSCPTEVLSNLNCPILLIDADNPWTFWNRDFLLENHLNPNYYFLGLQTCSYEMFSDFFGHSFSEDRYMYFPMATSFHKMDLQPMRNIVFLGSNWYGGYACLLPEVDQRAFEFLYSRYKEDFLFDFDQAKKDYKNRYGTEMPKIDADTFRWHFAGQERLKNLSELEDLGLEIYGNNWKYTGAAFDMELSLLDHGPLMDQEDVSNLYNSSKISVNFSHPQAKTSFSWRVMDIMASNSCLLMERKSDWLGLFGDLLSQEVKESVTYTDRFDMRKKAERLLNDEKLRAQCVTELQEAIEKNGRWESRIKLLEAFLKIKLNNHEKVGSILTVRPKEYLKNSNEPSGNLTNNKIKYLIKKTFSNNPDLLIFSCSAILAFAHTPILKKIIPDNIKLKAINKIKSKL